MNDNLKRFIINIASILPDSLYLKGMYRYMTGKKLNLKNPQTFNEKIQWLKLHDRKPIYTIMVDKFEVKKYVADMIGDEYIIPTLGVWDRFEDIDFDLLPDRFVLKCTHDSGGNVICRDKSKLDIEMVRKKINRSLKTNFYWFGREWPYKNVKPRIIAEKYMADGTKIVPEDYKIYCLHGEPKYIVVFHNRYDSSKHLSESVYDINWVKKEISLDQHIEISDIVISKPECLDELLKISRVLAKDKVQVRLDFYIINNKIFFSEITFFTASGFASMIPNEVDQILGKQLNLRGGE